MRVLCYANIFISYLLSAHKTDNENKIRAIVETGFSKQYTLLFPQELLEEIRKKHRGKPYLANHITQQEIEEFILLLSKVAEFLPSITEQIPVVSRDIKDDYLLAYAMVGNADYLITGDEDLLVLGRIGNVQIISSAMFYEIIA